MSIYQSKSKPPVGEGDVTQTVVRGAVATLNELRHGPGSSQDWTGVRKARPVNYLLPASMKWLTSLPKEIRPWALARQFPRIANFLALEWEQPESCAAWFDNLLVDQRRDKRKGFPADVHREVRALQGYFHRQSLSLSE
jgi:hypothetical protein